MRTPDFAHERRIERRPHHVAPSLASVRLILVSERMGEPLPGGSDAGLAVVVNSTARVLRRAGVHAETWKVGNGVELIERLEAESWHARRPITHVVINNPRFIPPHRYAEMSDRWVDTEFVQLNHSGLAYLSIDRYGVENIRRVGDLETALHNVRIAGNSQRFCHWQKSAYRVDNVLYLPNLYDIGGFRNPVVKRNNYDPLRIGAFGASRAWKNPEIAAEAALGMANRFGSRLEFHVNTGHWDNSGNARETRRQMFRELWHAKIIEVPWDKWANFRRTVGYMDLLISPSFDETFCVIAADGVAEGVPSVAGGAMDWTPRSWQCAEPWDPASVMSVGVALLHDKLGAVEDGRDHLREFVTLGTDRWISYLTR